MDPRTEFLHLCKKPGVSVDELLGEIQSKLLPKWKQYFERKKFNSLSLVENSEVDDVEVPWLKKFSVEPVTRVKPTLIGPKRPVPKLEGPLSRLCEAADLEEVKFLAKKLKSLINETDRKRRTPLLMAAFSGNTAIVKVLLSFDEITGGKTPWANPASQAGGGMQAIHMAAGHGHTEVLLKAGARVNAATSRDPRTPLDFALTGKQSDECAEFIKSKGGKTYSELKPGEFEDAEFQAERNVKADEERNVNTDQVPNKKRLRSPGEHQERVERRTSRSG